MIVFSKPDPYNLIYWFVYPGIAAEYRLHPRLFGV